MKILFIALLSFIILSAIGMDYIDYQHLPWKTPLGSVCCDREDSYCEEYFASIMNSDYSIRAIYFKKFELIMCFLYEENDIVCNLPGSYFFRLKNKYMKEHKNPFCC